MDLIGKLRGILRRQSVRRESEPSSAHERNTKLEGKWLTSYCQIWCMKPSGNAPI